MDRPIRILHLEDAPFDADFVRRELEKSHIAFEIIVVAKRNDFEKALGEFNPDIILSDHSLPSFDSIQALKIVKEKGLDIPFILVTSTMTEEFAVTVMKEGAWDYILKDRLQRLPSAIMNAIGKYSLEKEKQYAEKEKEFDRNNLYALINNTSDLLWSVDRNFNLITSNRNFDLMTERMSGQKILRGESVLSGGFTGEQIERFKKLYERAFSGESFTELEYNELYDRWSEISYYPIFRDEQVIGTACKSHDITERKRAEENLRQNESRLREAQSIARTGNWDFDIHNNQHYWSDELYKILELDRSVDMPSIAMFLTFIHPDDVNYVNVKVGKAFRDIRDSAFEFRLMLRDGAVRNVYCQWRFEFDQNGQPGRLFGIIQDVTERKLAEAEKAKTLQELIQRNKDLEQFAYIISHNLRGPVANIIGISEVIIEEGLDNTSKLMLNKALNESALKLDDVVKDLTNILQVRREITETMEFVAFSELVEDIRLSIKSWIEKEDARIDYDFTEVKGILTLKSYIYSIFYNLISNSIKYRRPDVPCEIKISSRASQEGIVLVFSDNGMGIDLKKKGNQIFGLYKRFHAHIEGKGMGLFMVKTQVETLRGKITINSEINKGTEFTIVFEN